MPKEPIIQRAEEVERVAQILISKYHPHLADVRLLYLFTDKKLKRCDRIRLGSAMRMNALQRFLSSTLESVESGHEWIIMIDMHEWEQLDDKQRRACCDHQLEHLKVFVKSGSKFVRLPDDQDKDDFSEWKIGRVDHDISDFAVTISRYGSWWPEGQPEHRATEAIRQLSLPGLAIMSPSRN